MDQLALVVAAWAMGSMTDQTTARFTQVASRFIQFVARADGCRSLADVTTSTAHRFVHARVAGRSPSVATQHFRRSVLRVFFATARGLGLVDHDPARDIVLPPRSASSMRPLSDDEIALVELWADSERSSTVVALAEATARTGEIPGIRICDVDLDQRRVWIAGTARNSGPREGVLTDWGVKSLRTRIDSLNRQGAPPETPIAYSGTAGGASGQAAACRTLSAVLRRAGLAGEADVRPHSIAAWAARRAYIESGRIEDAARAAGVASLDTAASWIGFDWRGDR